MSIEYFGGHSSTSDVKSPKPLAGCSQLGQTSLTQRYNESAAHAYRISEPQCREPDNAMIPPPPYGALWQRQMSLCWTESYPRAHLYSWPSQLLTSPFNADRRSSQQPDQQYILPTAPTQDLLSTKNTGFDLTPTIPRTIRSRRKLTDDERRLMCLEAKNNPNKKQVQIGAMFNVE